jgi:hypothetical protein
VLQDFLTAQDPCHLEGILIIELGDRLLSLATDAQGPMN